MKSLYARRAPVTVVERPGRLANLASGFSGLFRGPTLQASGVTLYGQSSILFPIVNHLASATAQVKWHLYVDGESGQEEDREEIMPGQHPAVDLFLNPNPFQSRSDFIETSQQHIDLVGESCWLIEYIASLPVRMWVLPPWKLTPVKGSIVRTPSARQFLLGWIYTSDDGQQVPLTLKDIIQIKQPDPNDPWRGIGPVQSAMGDLDAVRYSVDWNNNFFKNSAAPGGVVEIEEGWNDEEYNDFVRRWRESHQGVSNVARVAVLENNAKWVPDTNTHRDMQFTELRTLSADAIRAAFRYPKTMLGDTDSANRAVAEAGEYQFGKHMIDPRAERITGALNNRYMKLFPPDKREPKWDFDSVVESDEQVESVTVRTRAEAASTLITSGVVAEDAFAVSGLPPMKWEKPEPEFPPGFGDGPPGSKPAGEKKKEPAK